MEVAQADHILGQRLRDDGRDHCPRRLARAIGVERAHGDRGQIERAVEALH